NGVIDGNIINSNYMGLVCYYHDYGVTGMFSTFKNNIVYGNYYSTGYGIYAYYDYGAKVYHNTVYMTSPAGYGIYLYSSGTASQAQDVRDNIFYKTASGSYN